ncbi:hypothetical protein O3G_MSEX011896 [Manduca sexta]|uniref:THAP-type domain-containing protein n=1 Tax=Manduca sexta TaxID=7130 RepID=A0A922CUU1_MANSE|nr:hypothetical protein O3G_MSEX011896 [Manduca sexta]
MPPVWRCVFGCPTDGISLHNFPNPRRFPEQFQKWIELVGEPVEDLTPDEIFGKKKVCNLHFTIDDRNRNNRLNAIATPVPFPYQKTSKKGRGSQFTSCFFYHLPE